MAKKKNKLPRKLAGVKIPKSLRKSGTSLAGLLESPAAREILASVLTAAAGALAGNKTARTATADAGATVAEAGQEGAQHAAATSKDLTLAAADVVAGVARHVLPSSLVGDASKASDGDNEAPKQSRSFAPLSKEDPKAKKTRSRDKHRAH